MDPNTMSIDVWLVLQIGVASDNLLKRMKHRSITDTTDVHMEFFFYAMCSLKAYALARNISEVLIDADMIETNFHRFAKAHPEHTTHTEQWQHYMMSGILGKLQHIEMMTSAINDMQSSTWQTFTKYTSGIVFAGVSTLSKIVSYFTPYLEKPNEEDLVELYRLIGNANWAQSKVLVIAQRCA